MKALLQRELIATLRTPGSVTNPLGFLLLSLLLFAVVDPSAKDAQNGYLSGIFWVLILLTTMLTFDARFRRDYDSGALEQLVVGEARARRSDGVKLPPVQVVEGHDLAAAALEADVHDAARFAGQRRRGRGHVLVRLHVAQEA